MVLLDVAHDRYFSLTTDLEQALRTHLSHGIVVPALLEKLVASAVLVERPECEADFSAPPPKRPSRSAIEQPRRSTESIAANVIETTWIVYRMRHKLRSSPLKAVLDEAASYRSSRVVHQPDSSSAATERALIVAAQSFANARRYVPIEPTCLLDSLSLLRFLSRRGLSARVIFGVTAQPFTAHCWVQVADMVLNDTVTDAGAYTPIRTI